MNFLILSLDYPDNRRVNFTFVKQLVDELATQGHSVQVIAPYNISHNLRLIKKRVVQKVGHGYVSIYRPRYISFSHLHIGSFSFSNWSITKAFKKGLTMIADIPYVVYGHFWSSAYHGFHYAKKHNIPLFVATGESEIDFVCNTIDKIDFCDYVSGVICVSTKNKEESIAKKLTSKEKCIVLPNAIDVNLFKVLDKIECRKRLGYPIDAFIVAFVGWFNERKGAERVSKAISIIDGTGKVYSLFIGEGQQKPSCENILFMGHIAHDLLPVYLNAADIFVLPTLQEGCCNAVIEAMACGLPVVSSDLPFNWDVLNETNSILIDPNNIDEIASAISELRDNADKRAQLAEGSMKTAERLTIDKRAKSIIEFIDNNTI